MPAVQNAPAPEARTIAKKIWGKAITGRIMTLM
jgi:hypothetical protein